MRLKTLPKERLQYPSIGKALCGVVCDHDMNLKQKAIHIHVWTMKNGENKYMNNHVATLFSPGQQCMGLMTGINVWFSMTSNVRQCVWVEVNIYTFDAQTTEIKRYDTSCTYLDSCGVNHHIKKPQKFQISTEGVKPLQAYGSKWNCAYS